MHDYTPLRWDYTTCPARKTGWERERPDQRSGKVPMTDERYWRVPEVADHLRVDPETVRRWLRAHKLRGLLLSQQGGYRISESELRRFIAERLDNTESER